MGSGSDVSPPRGVNLVLPGAVLAILALMGYVAMNPPLESSRPRPSETQFPDPPSAPGLIGGYSRLWEDPLEAAYKLGSSSEQDAEKANVANIQKHMETLVRGALAVPHGDPKIKTRFHVMTVLLPGEPHAESSETRRRVRYAVTSALGVSGFHVAFPDRITFVDIPINVRIKAVDTDSHITLRVPLKLYRTTELHTHEAMPDTSRVLVLWVNESRLGKAPISSICTVLNTLFSHGKLPDVWSRIQFSVIGPTCWRMGPCLTDSDLVPKARRPARSCSTLR